MSWLGWFRYIEAQFHERVFIRLRACRMEPSDLRGCRPVTAQEAIQEIAGIAVRSGALMTSVTAWYNSAMWGNSRLVGITRHLIYRERAARLGTASWTSPPEPAYVLAGEEGLPRDVPVPL